MAALSLYIAALLPVLVDARAVAGPRVALPWPLDLPNIPAPLPTGLVTGASLPVATGIPLATAVTVPFPFVPLGTGAPVGTGIPSGVSWPPLVRRGVPPVPGTGAAGTAPPYPTGTATPPAPRASAGTAPPYPLGTAVPPLPGTGLPGTTPPYPTGTAIPPAPPGTGLPGTAPYPTTAASGYLPYASANTGYAGAPPLRTGAIPPLGTGLLTALPALATGLLGALPPPPLCLVGAIRCEGFHAWSVCAGEVPRYQSVGAVPNGLECANGQLVKQKGRDCAGEDGQIVCGADGSLQGVCESGSLVSVPANATGAGVGCFAGTLLPV